MGLFFLPDHLLDKHGSHQGLATARVHHRNDVLLQSPLIHVLLVQPWDQGKAQYWLGCVLWRSVLGAVLGFGH